MFASVEKNKKYFLTHAKIAAQTKQFAVRLTFVAEIKAACERGIEVPQLDHVCTLAAKPQRQAGDTQPGISAGSLLSPGPQAARYRFHCLDISVSEPLSLLVFIGVCLTVNISLLMLLDINQLR